MKSKGIYLDFIYLFILKCIFFISHVESVGICVIGDHL